MLWLCCCGECCGGVVVDSNLNILLMMLSSCMLNFSMFFNDWTRNLISSVICSSSDKSTNTSCPLIKMYSILFLLCVC